MRQPQPSPCAAPWEHWTGAIRERAGYRAGKKGQLCLLRGVPNMGEMLKI